MPGKSSKSSLGLYASRSIVKHLLPDKKILKHDQQKVTAKNHINKKSDWCFVNLLDKGCRARWPTMLYKKNIWTPNAQLISSKGGRKIGILDCFSTLYTLKHDIFRCQLHIISQLWAFKLVGHIYFWQIEWSPKTSHKCETVKSDMFCETTCNRLSWQ